MIETGACPPERWEFEMAKKNRSERAESGKGTSAQYANVLPAEEVAAYLEALASALRSESILVQTNDETLEAAVGQSVEFDLDVKPGEKKSSLRLRLSWEEPQTEPELSITSQ
jgi:amphi-Trp domain-containing protein